MTHSESLNIPLNNKIEKMEVFLNNEKIIISGNQLY